MTSGQIFNAIVDFFEEDDWDFHWMEGLSVLTMGFTGRNARWTCYAQAREAQEQFVFYSVCPIIIPPDKRTAVAEFITRANYGMIIGNFELDFNDGEVRYKTSIDVEGDTLRAPLIKQMVYANVMILDRYLPGILRVCYGDGDPEAEVARVENVQRGASEETRPSFSLDDFGLPMFIRDDDDDDDADDESSADDDADVLGDLPTSDSLPGAHDSAADDDDQDEPGKLDDPTSLN
jgi:hypothetical protein